MKTKTLFVFDCKKCGKAKRESISEEKAQQELCRICRNIKVNPDQLPLL